MDREQIEDHAYLDSFGVTYEYLIAVNRGSEGWELTEFETSKDLLDFILSGGTNGYPFRVLRTVELLLGEYL